MKQLGLAALIMALAIGGAVSADGDTYRCVVADFRYGSPDSDPDVAFREANLRKKFDIFDLGDRFKVIANSKGFRSSTDEYRILDRGLIGTVALSASGVSSLEGLVLYAPTSSAESGKIAATISTQSSDSVNVWYLSCVAI